MLRQNKEQQAYNTKKTKPKKVWFFFGLNVFVNSLKYNYLRNDWT
jgi:hypothetical protein